MAREIFLGAPVTDISKVV